MLLEELTCFLVEFPIPIVPWACCEPLRSNSPHPPEKIVGRVSNWAGFIDHGNTLIGWNLPDIAA